jgi:hypothetical protein
MVLPFKWLVIIPLLESVLEAVWERPEHNKTAPKPVWPDLFDAVTFDPISSLGVFQAIQI